MVLLSTFDYNILVELEDGILGLASLWRIWVGRQEDREKFIEIEPGDWRQASQIRVEMWEIVWELSLRKIGKEGWINESLQERDKVQEMQIKSSSAKS